MTQQSQAIKTQPDKKNGHKPELAVALQEPACELADAADLAGRLPGASADGTAEAQAAWLADARLQMAQRRALASRSPAGITVTATVTIRF